MGYITSFGYFQGAIWFYNSRAPQICFRNFWDQKIDRDETRDGCDLLRVKKTCIILTILMMCSAGGTHKLSSHFFEIFDPHSLFVASYTK